MNAHYNLDQPRVEIKQFDSETYETTTREIGQSEAYGEASFWMSIGYTVSFSVWDGKKFVEECRGHL